MNSGLREQFLQGMSLAAATVNVVTTDGVAGRTGVTVSAMTSISADGDAPTLLVCVHHLSTAASTIIRNGCFCANILRDDQSHISDAFAGRTTSRDGDKFSCASWHPMSGGVPRVDGALAAFACTVKSSERVGTHHVFVGEVQEIFTSRPGNPLIYANRAYGSPVRLKKPPPPNKRQATYRIGSLHTFGPYLLPAVLRQLQDTSGALEVELHEGDQRYLMDLLRGGAIDFALVYDLALGDDVRKHHLADLSTYVLLAKDDPLARQSALSLHDLLAQPMVLLDAPPSSEYFLSLFASVGEPRVSYRAKSFEMVRGMVAHGLGYSLLATKPASAMSYDGKALVTRPLSGKYPPSALALCHLMDAAIDHHFIRSCRAHLHSLSNPTGYIM